MSTMSELDLDRQLLDAVSEALKEPGLSPAEQIERKIDWIVRELDELCILANNPETVDLVDNQRVGIGQIISRSQLIGSFLLSRKPSLKVVPRG